MNQISTLLESAKVKLNTLESAAEVRYAGILIGRAATLYNAYELKDSELLNNIRGAMELYKATEQAMIEQLTKGVKQ